MKTKAKIFIIAASLGLLSTQTFTAPSGINRRDHFRFDRTNPAGQDPIVENNYYYGDGDYIYDYYYASRIRRFHNPYVSYSYYNSYYYDPYPWYPVYNIVYSPRIVNRYYYNTWYGNRIRYHRPYYANRYNYYNNYRDFHKGGYYSRSYKYASNYDAGNNYRKNQVVPTRTSIDRDNNRNSNVINSSRRSSPTNTSRTGNYNRSAEKERRVVSNSDVGRRNTASDRTIIENRNGNRNVSSVTKTNRSDENRRIVTNTRRNTQVPKTNSNSTRISKPANTKRPSSYRVPVKTRKSNVRSGNSRSNNSSKKATRSSGDSKSDQKKSSGRRR